LKKAIVALARRLAVIQTTGYVKVGKASTKGRVSPKP
jgi:hypothetical protein